MNWEEFLAPYQTKPNEVFSVTFLKRARRTGSPLAPTGERRQSAYANNFAHHYNCRDKSLNIAFGTPPHEEAPQIAKNFVGGVSGTKDLR
jgi:hypothetical protein